MNFTHSQFGDFAYDEKHVVQFPQGLVGFERLRKFLIVDDEDSHPFRWLVSLEDADLSFPLLDPSMLIPDYKQRTGFGEGSIAFVIASLDENPARSTVNLKSPLVIDEATRIGRQVILDNEPFAVQHPLFPSHAASQ